MSFISKALLFSVTGATIPTEFSTGARSNGPAPVEKIPGICSYRLRSILKILISKVMKILISALESRPRENPRDFPHRPRCILPCTGGKIPGSFPFCTRKSTDSEQKSQIPEKIDNPCQDVDTFLDRASNP